MTCKSWSAHGFTLSESASTIMYSSSIPNPPNSPSCFSLAMLDPLDSRSDPGDSAAALLEPIVEVLQDGQVQLVLQHGVLDPRLDAGVIVDLDHHQASADFLEVHTVQSVADQAGRLHGKLHHLGRRIANRKRFRPAVRAPVGGGCLLDLPVTARHVVAARIQRFSVEYAN